MSDKIDKFIRDHVGPDGECPEAPVHRWVNAVAAHQTRLGYWEWAYEQCAKLADREKIELIRALYHEAYELFESFRERNVGANLAYLFAAIATGSGYECDGENEGFDEWLRSASETTWGEPLKRIVDWPEEGES